MSAPSYKIALYGIQSDVGKALMNEALQRSYELTAVVDDLNGVSARAGLRTKLGDVRDTASVKSSSAGMNAVICVLPERISDISTRHTIDSLLQGLAQSDVKRLLLIGDFSWLDSTSALSETQRQLTDSTIGWTLVEAPMSDDPTELQRFAAGALDEVELCLHVHCRLHLIDQKNSASARIARASIGS